MINRRHFHFKLWSFLRLSERFACVSVSDADAPSIRGQALRLVHSVRPPSVYGLKNGKSQKNLIWCTRSH